MVKSRQFQSLIGTVQRKNDRYYNFLKQVSITLRYGSTKKTLEIIHEAYMFQSLIGTVQQQCLLRFMFSLYLISTVFQSFSPKKSVNLFIVNSRKALILLAFLFLSKLARRFTDFFYRFFNNLCFNQRKSSSPLTKTEASFEYLNHTRNPAFAVHPCPSPIFCHQEDKSELRGATPHFLPRLTPKPAQEWLPANFTVHSDFSSLFLPYGYFHRLLPL